nr:ROK family protein [Kineococcus siccus]
MGIDLGGTWIKWEHVADDGRSLAAGRVATPTGGHVEVTEAIAAVCAARAGEAGRPTGLGIAVPGHLTPERDGITLLPNVSGQWRGYPARAVLAERTGLEAVLLNDARAFAVAELGGAAPVHGVEEVVFVTIGTGIGGALAVRGEVVSSRRDSFGELGHTSVVVDGEECGCGGRGCVEAYAGGAALLARARARGVAVEPGAGALTSLALAARSEPAAAQVLTEAYDAFAVGVSNACALAGAGAVVVGGAVAEELPGYATRLRQRLSRRRRLLGDVEVLSAALGPRAGALGAALAARAGHVRTGEGLVLQP